MMQMYVKYFDLHAAGEESNSFRGCPVYFRKISLAGEWQDKNRFATKRLHFFSGDIFFLK